MNTAVQWISSKPMRKNRDGKRFLHIHIRIHDGKVEKTVVHDLLKSELVHDPSLQQVAVLDSFTVRCSASYESDIFSNSFQDMDFPVSDGASLMPSKNMTFREED